MVSDSVQGGLPAVPRPRPKAYSRILITAGEKINKVKFGDKRLSRVSVSLWVGGVRCLVGVRNSCEVPPQVAVYQTSDLLECLTLLCAAGTPCRKSAFCSWRRPSLLLPFFNYNCCLSLPSQLHPLANGGKNLRKKKILASEFRMLYK